MLSLRSKYFTTPQKKTEIDFLLFCFPFAGAGASYFNAWAPLFNHSNIQLCGVQYPGRENRFHDPLVSDISIWIDQFTDQIPPFSAGIPFAFFGHSMGVTIAHEVALALAQKNQPTPEFLGFSGRNPPHYPRQSKDIDHLNDHDFILEIKKLGNLAQQIIDDPDLMKYLLPIMRNDTRLLRNYQPSPLTPLPCPLHLFAGDQDPFTSPHGLSQWEQYTASECNLNLFAGNHFFINSHKAEICTQLKNRIKHHQLT